jgi:hypothetical protein
MDISGEGSGCNQITGSFEVRDIACVVDRDADRVVVAV